MYWLSIFQIIPQILSLPVFIRTTEKVSHVSDFRGQPRTDSRADKPDSFYGFDFIEEPTTLRTKTRGEIYTQLIGGILSTVRERITSAVEKNSINLQNLSEKLRNYPTEIGVMKLEQKSSLTEDKREIEKNNDESLTTEFEGLMLDEDNENVSDINIESDNGDGNNKNVDILSTFLSSLFLNKNNRMAAGGDIDLNSDIKKKMDAIKDFLLNRLVDVWSLTSKHFNFNKFANITETDVYDDKEIEQIAFVTNSTKSSELKSIDDVSFSTVGTSTSTPNLLVFNENTKLAYQNAFAKYSNLVTKGYFNRTVKIDLVDDNSTERDESPNNLDSVGIMLLEFFGTIAGLTWGAIAQVSAVFQRM